MIKKWKLNMNGPGVMAREVIIEAVNPREAALFAEARFPGMKAGTARQVN